MPVKRISVGGGIEAKLARMARGLKRGAVVRVGFLEGATYPDGTSVPMVAAIQEFGAPSANIPPRPFFRGMIKDKSSEWPAGLAQALADNDYDAERALDVTGQAIAGQLRQAIIDYDAGPPLKPATIARKGHDRPLIDTGHMLNSIDYEVEST